MYLYKKNLQGFRKIKLKDVLNRLSAYFALILFISVMPNAYATNNDECSSDVPLLESVIHTYPQDSDGWSIIKPSTDTRIVYVSSSEGDDSRGKVYTSGQNQEPFNPIGVQSFKTVEAAYRHLRDGKPDWILLKRGDVFFINGKLDLKSGRAQNAHLLIGAYGDKASPRPILDTGASSAFSGIKDRSFITVLGIEFYASGRDPESEQFIGWMNVKPAAAISNVAGKIVRGMHFENNRFNYYGLAINLGAVNEAKHKNVVLRRNQILNSYSTKGHSQGIFLNTVEDALVEENLFDHNGWFQQRPSTAPFNNPAYGYATMFNHNVYITNSNNLLIRKNLSSRSSSIGMKFTSNSNKEAKIDTINSTNILLEENLLVEGEVGFSIGGNTDFNNGYRWDGIHVVGNVLTNIGRTSPTNRKLSFNIESNDWKTGSICSNYIVDRDDKDLTNTYGIQIQGHVDSIKVEENRLINYSKADKYSEDDRVKNYGNMHVPLVKGMNFLDSYVKSKKHANYRSYITSVIEELRESSYSYYDVQEAIRYIKTHADQY